MPAARKKPIAQEPEAANEAASAAPEPVLDAVIVVKQVGEDGSVNTAVLLNGTVQPTEVQTLLELGVKSWREQIGLSKR